MYAYVYKFAGPKTGNEIISILESTGQMQRTGKETFLAHVILSDNWSITYNCLVEVDGSSFIQPDQAYQTMRLIVLLNGVGAEIIARDIKDAKYRIEELFGFFQNFQEKIQAHLA